MNKWESLHELLITQNLKRDKVFIRIKLKMSKTIRVQVIKNVNFVQEGALRVFSLLKTLLRVSI